jgi:hypothetical protein
MKKVSVILLLLAVLAATSSVAQVPVVNHARPSAGLNRQAVTAHVYGNNYNFAPPSVRLAKAGFPDINGTSVVVQSDEYLTCSFDLTDASTGLYSLISTNIFGQDTLLGCFTVYSKSYSPVTWVPTSVGTGGWYMDAVALGDGDGDGEIEVYGACWDDSLYQFKWNGTSWDKTLVGFATWAMTSAAVGDGNADTDLDVYATSLDGVLYQFQWDGMTWLADSVGEAWEGLSGVAIGDGNNDAVVELYASSIDDTLYSFEWDGAFWIGDMVGFGGNDLTGVAAGDGDDDGTTEVYVSCLDNHVFQFTWSGAAWVRDTVGFGGAGMLGVALGDGNADGEPEVYGACADNNVYQFKYDGVNWLKTTVGTLGDQVGEVAVGDGNGDGSREVYVSCYDMGVYEFKWTGAAWAVDTVGAGTDTMLGVAAGDGNNDGKMEVYGANLDSEVYQFAVIKLPDIELSDTLYDFGFVLVGDSADWTDLSVKNDGTADLIVGGIISDTAAFSIISPSFADTIVPDDSSLVTVRFKPLDLGAVVGTLSVFSNDPDESPLYITVLGGGTSGPDIELSDSLYDFGPVSVGDSLDWSSLLIYNLGVGPLSVDSLVSDNPVYQVVGFAPPETVQVGDSTAITVRFKPDIDDTLTGTLTVHSSDQTSPALPVLLSGVGADATPPLPFGLLSPPDSAITADPRPTFIWQSTIDALSGLRDYELYVDASVVQTLVDTMWLLDFDLTEDWHDWYVVAYDSAANPQNSNETWSIGVDLSPPVIESTTVWLDTSFAGPFEVTTKVTDLIAGVDSVRLYYRRDEDPSWVSADMALAVAPDWFVDSIPQVFIAGDTVRYYIEAVDRVTPAHVATDPVGAPTTYYSFVANLVGIQELRATPARFSFSVKSNPAKNRMIFGLSLPASGRVSLRVYDTSGRLVDEPLGDTDIAGVHEIYGRPDLASGVYFYRLESPWETRTGKLVLLR